MTAQDEDRQASEGGAGVSRMAMRLISAVAVLAIFYVDTLVPEGMALPFVYVILVAIVSRRGDSGFLVVLGVVVTLLTFLELLLSPWPEHVSLGMVLFNRGSAVVALWAIVLAARAQENAQIVADATSRLSTLAEARVALSEQRLSAALEAGGVFAFEWNPTTDVVFRTENCKTILGWTDDARQDTGSSFFDRIVPEDRIQFTGIIRTLGPQTPEYHTTYRYYRPSGGIAYLEETGKGEFGPDGAIVRLRGLTADVTQKFLAAEEIAASEVRFRNLANAMPQVVWIAGEDGAVLYYNDRVRELAGMSQRPDGTWEWAPAVHPDDAAPTTAAWTDAVKTQSVYEIEHRIRMVDGTYRWHLSRAFPIREGSGRLRWYGTATDVHVARSAHEALREADRRKEEFLAVLSHELRTPLTAAYGWAKLLSDPSLGDEQTIRLGLDTIESSLRAQTKLIDELLDVSRITSGKLVLDPEPLDLRTVIDDALLSIRLGAETKGITINCDHGPEPLPLLGDVARLRQVIWNLLANAVKFTPDGGSVSIRARRDDDAVEAVVSDTGIGIDPSFLPLVFNRFTQADTSTTRGAGGLGLGLAIVRHLVELHGGTVQAESEGPGKGARFTVRIPVSPNLEKIKADSTARGGTLEGWKVLVVEDDAATRELMTVALTKAGARVRPVPGGAVALSEHETWRPDAIVSDLGMPEIDGNMMIEEIRRSGSTVPALAVTAHADVVARQAAMAAGFDAFLPKPFAPKDLVAAVVALRHR